MINLAPVLTSLGSGGGGSSLTAADVWNYANRTLTCPIIIPIPSIPFGIDLADTATVRLGIAITDGFGDLPSTAEITPGTVSIARKAMGGTSWTAVRTDVALSEQAGMAFLDETFSVGNGYDSGDHLKITFKGIKVTVGAKDYEICGADGLQFQTLINDNVASIVSVSLNTIKGAGWSSSTDTLEKIRDELSLMEGTGFATATHSQVSIVALINALNALLVAIEGSGFDGTTDSLSQIRELSDKIYSWARKTNGNMEHQLTRGMIADLRRGNKGP